MATTPTFGWPTPDDTDLVRDGAEAMRDLGDAIDAYATGGYLYAGTIYYTSSGTFVKADPFGTGDIGLRAIRVRLVGGGGGGGGCATTGANQNTMGGGGGGGAYAESFITDIAGLDASVTVTRGAGGAGGVGSTLSLGSAGGQSSFGALVSADGGDGAGSGGAGTVITDFYTSGPGDGGATFTGDFGFAGGGGNIGQRAQTVVAVHSPGGPSAFSKTPGTAFTTSGANGPAGTGHGNGGSGAANTQNQGTVRDGGTGSNGIVIVDCFV